MNTLEIINKALSKDNEDLHFELKKSDKYYKNNKIKLECLLITIVSFANRDGGRLIIGINDDGTPEGKDIFNKFLPKSKKAIDDFKNMIINKCTENISPIVEIVIEYHNNDVYEFIEIIIPKRKDIPHAIIKRSNEHIKERLYYIRTSSSTKLVTDSQLNWLFSKEKSESENDIINIEVTTYKDIGGIPINASIGPDKFIMQPEKNSNFKRFLHGFTEESYEKCKIDSKYKNILVTESLLYSILESLWINGTKGVPLPQPNNDFFLHDAIKGKEDELINRFDKNMNIPPKSIMKVVKDEKGIVKFILKNSYYNLNLKLYCTGRKMGCYGTNPYAQILVDKHGIKGQDYLFKRYESFKFILEAKVEFLFPEVMDENYNISYDFSRNIIKRIKVLWDINEYMNRYPHYRSLYHIDYNIERLIEMIKEKK